MASSPNMDETQHGQTQWSVIIDAIDKSSPSASESLSKLADRYRPAIYAYIRSTGKDPDAAEDLTQGFMADVMLGRNLLESADPNRGRFRSLLIRSVSNYIRDRHRYDSSTLRSPKDGYLGRIDDSQVGFDIASSGLSPDQAFARQWVTSIIQDVIVQVEKMCIEKDQAAHWDIFNRRLIRPMLEGDDPASYETLVRDWNLKGTAQVANMLVTVKRRFARAIAESIRDTVEDESQVQAELLDLLRLMEDQR